MTCSSSVGLVIRCNITLCQSSKVSSEDKLPVVILMYGGHNRAHGPHGGRVPRVPRGGYAPGVQWGASRRWPRRADQTAAETLSLASPQRLRERCR